jgi:hypothetical protein
MAKFTLADEQQRQERANKYHESLAADESDSFGQEVVDFVTYGLPTAVVSGAVGTINTGYAFANMLGADIESVDTATKLQDWGWENAGSYYEDHKSTVDAVGFGLSALIPGMIGIKAARATQAGLRASQSTSRVVKGLNKALVPEAKAEKFITSVKNGADTFNNFKLGRKAAASGFHQQFVEAAFAETAILLTNANNPTITKEGTDYHEAILSNAGGFAFGLVLGGGIGGLIQTATSFTALRKVYGSYVETANKLGQGQDLTPWGFQNGSIVGDNITVMHQQLTNARENSSRLSGIGNEADLGQVKQINAQSKQLENDIKGSLAFLTGEAFKRDVKGTLFARSGDKVKSAPQAELLFNMLENAQSDQALGMMAGLNKVSKFSDKDLMFDPTSQHMEIVPAGKWEARLTELFGRKPDASTLDPGTNGVAFGDPNRRGKYIAIRDEILKDGSVSEDEAIFIMRHEMGHNTANRLGSAFGIGNPTARTIRDQAEKLSRQARPAAWKHVDALPKLHQQMNAAVKAGETNRIGLLSAAIRERQEYRAYLGTPQELLADSWAVFNTSEDIFKASAKSNPQLYKLMRDNSALKNMLGQREALVDVNNFDMYSIADRVPTVADTGNLTFSARNGNVSWGDGQESGATITKFGSDRINLKAKQFNVLEVDDPLEASANYYAASRTKVKITEGQEIPWTDFATLNLLHKRATAGDFTGSVAVTMPDSSVKNFRFGESEFAGADANIQTFESQFKAFKAKAVGNLRNSILDTGKPTRYTNGMIARITDTGESFAEVSGAVGKHTTFWSQEYNPSLPTTMKLHYQVKTEIADKVRASALADVHQRVRTTMENVYTTGTTFLTKVGGGAVETMPLPSVLSGIDHGLGVTEATGVKNLVGAVQHEYGKSLGFIEATGTANKNSKVASDKLMDDITGAAIQIVKNDGESMVEGTVLDTTLRRDFYKFAPSTEEDLIASVANRLTKEENVPRVQVIVDALTPTFSAAAKKGRVLWSRDLDDQITSLMTTKKFGQSGLTKLQETVEKSMVPIQSPKLVRMWEKLVQANRLRVEGAHTVASIRGLDSNLDPDVLYPGPFDVNKYQFRKYVVPVKEGIYGDGRSGMIAANSAEELATKEAQIMDEFGGQVIIKSAKEVETDAKFKGVFDGALEVTEHNVNSLKLRKGVMFDAIPDVSPDLFDHYSVSGKRQMHGIIDNITEGMLGEEFATLRAQSSRLQTANTTAGQNKGKALKDPHQEAMDTMLNRSNGENPSKWRVAQQDVDKTISSVANSLTGFLRVKGTEIDYKQMNKYMRDQGLPEVYSNKVGQEILATTGVSEQLLANIIPKANGIAATMMLRFLETVQPMVTAFSTPIMAIPEMAHLIEALPELRRQQLVGSLSHSIPESAVVDAAGATVEAAQSMPSNTRLMFQAVKDFWTKPELVDKYYQLGFTPSVVREMREVAESIAVDPKLLAAGGGMAKFEAGIAKSVDVLSTPADKMESMVKFVAARMADLALEAGGVAGSNIRNAAINGFVKRVHGNYVYSQRPTLFQGFAGQAIGLFQTYQFNMIQQLMRHVGDGQVGAATGMLSLQGGIFGAQSLPGFRALNEHIGQKSTEGNDFYTGTKDVLGDDVSEWLLYGLSSNFTKPVFGNSLALYTRGDVNPRSPILLPTSMEEIPVINLTTKFVSNLARTAANLAGGNTPVGQVFLDALAKNGVNRPLSGIGQMIAGAKTTNQGSLVASLQDVDWMTRFARVSGATVLDESIAVQGYYRAKGYDTYRREQLNDIGAATKAMVQSGNWDGEAYRDTFESYAQVGGTIDYYDKWVHSQYMGATNSIIDDMYQSHNSSSGRYMQNLLGADIRASINPTYIPNTPTGQ